MSKPHIFSGPRRARWGGALVCAWLAACGASQDDSASAERSAEADEAGPGSGSSLEARPEGGDDSAGDSLGAAEPAREAGGISDVSGGESAFPAAPADSGGVAPFEGNGAVQAGTLTAGAWDDSRNFERFLEFQRDVAERQLPGLPVFDEAAQRAAAEQAAQLSARTTLDVALVIDTTGSMGDELSYLQSEFEALSSAIEARYPDAEQRWALVVYRDDGDEYVARAFDFEAAAGAFRERLGAQSAGGGGDYPEAPDAALEAMNQLGWRSDAAAARLAFWVADAPHHAENTGALEAAVEVAAEQGIHLYPVASSGVDELTEYTMRAAAQLTLGRYLFLTDDSGVGGAHAEPTIPCYFVTRLDHAILRMVDIEMTGAYREPEPEQVLRSGGDPQDGACVLESGETLSAF